MRLSSDQKDPDYWSNHFGCCPDVFLGGILMHHVVEADTRKGFVVVEKWIDGKPVRDGDSIKRERITGNVSIVNRDPGAPTGGTS